MQARFIGANTNCFWALFGGGSRPLVEGGRYPMRGSRITNLGIKVGDVVLLYCSGTYPNQSFSKSVPGVGIVTNVGVEDEMEVVNYEWNPLAKTVELDHLRNTIPEISIHEPFSYRGNWLFEVSQQSLRQALSL